MRFLILAGAAMLSLGTAAYAQSGSAGSGGDTFGGSGWTPGTQPSSNAASNLPGQENRPRVAPSLPAPPEAGSKPSDFLRIAQGALAAGRTGEAQQAMEMAQTRMLDRSVPLGQTGVPNTNPTVVQISEALQALGARNRAGSMQALQAALASATAQGD